jgi:DDE_Tnp_1-associated
VPALLSSPVTRLAAHRVPGGEVVPGQHPDLLRYLAALPDPRDRRGLRHDLAGVLAVAVCAVLAGAKSLAAIGEWAADAPSDVLVSLGIRPDPLTGVVRAPDEATVRRVLTGIDADALDAAVGAWLQAMRAPAPASAVGRMSWSAVAVDGKTLRGSGCPGDQVHLLAVMDHTSCAVLGQVEVDGKSNEVRREALCRIPGQAGMNSEGGSWARRLTWIRKVKGTEACRDGRWPCPDAWSGAAVSPRDMAKAVLPESQSPAMQLFIHRKWRLKPVPSPAPVYFVGGGNFRDVGRCPVRAFKGMSGAPTSRCYVRQGRTRDRLPGASPTATECP